ncbi:hypothetical protein [Mesorhizobium sp. BR-1-1-10]|uniref:hypothetical protein n=1 Tax=Mesorhizobium sp. BR-1-1-10 TaxID=2876660 RepID=UPI001CD0C5F2|nr:hypothetical protein [Mesorhizobium sp. BR-1-1-10]MBZ9975497.1 hypothetical protein [Mesorhizobium sp. BR-1-1-10]
MTRDEARAAFLRQIAGMPEELAETGRKLLLVCDEIEDDAHFVNDTTTVRAALQFCEYLATGVYPKTDTVQ